MASCYNCNTTISLSKVPFGATVSCSKCAAQYQVELGRTGPVLQIPTLSSPPPNAHLLPIGKRPWIQNRPKTEWTNQELQESASAFIHKKFFKDGFCSFCASTDLPQVTAHVHTSNRRVGFKVEVCCPDLEVAIDEVLSDAKARLEMLKGWQEQEGFDYGSALRKPTKN